MRKFLILGALVLFGWSLNAQELNCQVVVNAQQSSNSNLCLLQ